MITLAGMAAKEAALTTGAAASLTHGFAPVVGGFAVGALATGACCLAFAAPRMRRRPRLATRDGMWGTGRRRSRVTRDYYAAPVDVDAPPTNAGDERAEAAVPEAEVAPGLGGTFAPEAAVDLTGKPVPETAENFSGHPAAEAAADLAGKPVPEPASSLAETFAPEAEVLAEPGADAAVGINRYAELADLSSYEPAAIDVLAVPAATGDLPGKHRITSLDTERRSEARRAAPKHAAPSAGLVSKMSGRLAALPLAARS
jgi:hypothetical protein